MGRYDIIGDIHGCASHLRALLDDLGYREDVATGGYRHPERQAIFVGDLVDRGDGQLEVLTIVKQMFDGGSAQIVMGNHEFNAVAFATEWPEGSGQYLRRRSEKNTKQHQSFLDQVTGDTRAAYLEWFASIPLWLDLGDVRIVHACWHEPSMRVAEEALGGDRFTSTGQLVRASTKGNPLYDAIEVLLKGPEISLASHRQPRYKDKDGHVRDKAGSPGGETTRRRFTALPSWMAISKPKADNRIRSFPTPKSVREISRSAIEAMSRSSTATTGAS